jgi:hypothetical protein
VADCAVIQDTQYEYSGGGRPICNMYIEFPGTNQNVGFFVNFVLPLTFFFTFVILWHYYIGHLKYFP